MIYETEFKKVLWALDSAADDLDVQRPLVDLLRPHILGRDMIVEPVCVLTREAASRMMEIEHATRLSPRLAEWLERKGIPDCLPLKVLHAEKDADAGAVLAEYASQNGHELIAVASHARSGVDRLILGSFAETLLMCSEVPVLVVNPHQHHAGPIETILFPTDFSTRSWATFETALGLAQTLRAKLVLFHEIDGDAAAAEREMNEWVQFAKANGVVAVGRVEKQGRNAGDTFLAFESDIAPQLVIMNTDVSAARARLLDSTVREVIRHTRAPVIVWGPETAG